MPTPDTFDCPPIAAFVKKYIRQSNKSLDLFARNKHWATITNDLNSKTNAMFHYDSAVFMKAVVKARIKFDLVLFDPPYSPRQIKECYDGIGLTMGGKEALRTNWKIERDLIEKALTENGVVLSFGWNTVGMGKKRGFVIKEILLVCHGASHNDTICMAETRIANQKGFKF